MAEKMNQVQAFKNFNMGTEIDIAGHFIYEGIRQFDRIECFQFEDEVFSFLYHVSVGVERLQKVLLVLLEDITDFEKFEEDLKTHNHIELQAKIEKNTSVKLTPREDKFIRLISNFYKNYRYNRFTINGLYNNEIKELIAYIDKVLKVDYETSLFKNAPLNNAQIKNIMGRVIGTIAQKYWKAIKEQVRVLGIFTDELRVESAAYKLFLGNFRQDSVHQQISDEQIALKEILIFLLNTPKRNGFYDFLKTIEPLDLDIALLNENLSFIVKNTVSQDLIDQIDSCYCEEEINIKERIAVLECIGNEHCHFHDEDEDEELEKISDD